MPKCYGELLLTLAIPYMRVCLKKALLHLLFEVVATTEQEQKKER